MITISIYGLDQYAVGHYSKEQSVNIANILETNVDNINFYAPNAYVLHNGVEQTSWNALVKISLPEKFRVFEEELTEFIFKTITLYTINVAVEFYYYDLKHRHEFKNKDYPPFIKEENLVHVEETKDVEDEEIYEGNIFENLEEQIEIERKKRSK